MTFNFHAVVIGREEQKRRRKRWKESITIDGKSGISHVKRVNNKRVLRKRSLIEKFYFLGHFI